MLLLKRIALLVAIVGLIGYADAPTDGTTGDGDNIVWGT
jgi:hypothetical protein